MADSERLRERIRYETEVVKLMTLVTVAIGGGSSSLLLGLGVTTTTWFRISVGAVGFIATFASAMLIWRQHRRIRQLLDQFPEAS